MRSAVGENVVARRGRDVAAIAAVAGRGVGVVRGRDGLELDGEIEVTQVLG